MAVDWVTSFLRGLTGDDALGRRAVLNVVSDGTPTLDIDVYGGLNISALAENVTALTVTGTPTDMQQIVTRVTDDGVSRNINFGAQFDNGNFGASTPGESLLVLWSWNETLGLFFALRAIVEA